MKKRVKIIWNKSTPHSRFWALLFFVGVLPAASFYAGVKVEELNRDQEVLQRSSYEVLFQSEHGNCRISDCTIQPIENAKKAAGATNTTIPAIQVVSPKQGDRLDSKTSVKVIWNTSPSSSIDKVSVLLLDSNGRAVSKSITVSASTGSTTISRPAKLSGAPFTILIQGLTKSKTDSDMPFAYSGEFYL